MSSKPFVRAVRLGFSYPSSVEPVLSDVSFHLPPGFTGVVGPNGGGKTTLLGLLRGGLVPSEGTLSFEPPDPLVAFVPQEVEAPSREVLEFGERSDAEAWAWFARLSLDPLTLPRWPTLSPGERKRWQLAAALSAGPDVLLLDEPSNHLDVEGRALVEKALGGFRGVGVVVSHDRALLDSLTSSTLLVERGEVRSSPLPYSAARAVWDEEAKTAQHEREEKKRQLQKRKAQLQATRTEHQQAEAQRSTRARMKNKHDSDARGMLAQVKADWAAARLGRSVANANASLEDAEGELASAEVEKELGRSVFLQFERAPQRILGQVADEARSGDFHVRVPSPLLFTRDSRIWVRGANGAGKTTLLTALLRSMRPDDVLVLPQDLSTEEMARTLERVRALDKETRGRVLSLVAALGVDPDRLLATASPSPGEGRKLALALGLGQHAKAAVLDEPTNHLDLPSVERLERALSSYPGALLVVTHDARFAGAVTNEVWRVSDGVAEVERR